MTIAEQIIQHYYDWREKKDAFLTEFDLSFDNFKYLSIDSFKLIKLL